MHGNIRSKPILRFAHNEDLGCYLRFPGCEGTPTEPAHSNQAKHGKGGGMKAHDCFTVPACRPCHYQLDQGKELTRDERREEWERAYWEYAPVLINAILSKEVR